MNQKQFYKGSARRRVRDAYIAERVAIDGGVCEVCGVELGKIAHHKIWPDEESGILSTSHMSARLATTEKRIREKTRLGFEEKTQSKGS